MPSLKRHQVLSLARFPISPPEHYRYERLDSNQYCTGFKPAASAGWATLARSLYERPDSNRHCTGFESVASACWATLAFDRYEV